jgi:hypothetical protein
VKNSCLAAIFFVCMVTARSAGASAITLEIAYPGMSPTAENGLSTITLSGTTASFEHSISNISPQLLQFTAAGTQLSSITVTAFDGGTLLGELVFNDAFFTSVTSASGLTERVSFAFSAPGAGFYALSYPGMPANAENDISSLTLNQTSASFTHLIGNLSPKLLQFTASGVQLPNLTFTHETSALPTLQFDDVFFTGLTLGASGLDENVSFAFDKLAIQPPGGTDTSPVPEPGSCLLLASGVIGLVVRRRRLAHRHEPSDVR